MQWHNECLNRIENGVRGSAFLINYGFGLKAAEKRTRVVLHNVKTRQYYARSGEWAPDRQLAHDFGQFNPAADFARENGFADVEVILVFNDPREDIHFPLPRRVRPS